MTDETALKITGELTFAFIATMGIPGMRGPDLDVLRPLSLSDMLRANDHVEAINERTLTAPADGQPRTIHTVVADRGIAAIYAALHHQPSEQGEVEPLVLLDGRALCLIAVRPAEEDPHGH